MNDLARKYLTGEDVRSSYKSGMQFNEFFRFVVWQMQPQRIIEFGILDAYSLSAFVENAPRNCKITAYDIFDQFNGNHANYQEITKKFEKNENVDIKYGDYYKIHELIPNKSVDIIHIDIANDRTVYEFAIKHYLPKLTKNGILILEGGSSERDQVPWMKTYNKLSIAPYVEVLGYSKDLRVNVIDSFPSITIISNSEQT